MKSNPWKQANNKKLLKKRDWNFLDASLVLLSIAPLILTSKVNGPTVVLVTFLSSFFSLLL